MRISQESATLQQVGRQACAGRQVVWSQPARHARVLSAHWWPGVSRTPAATHGEHPPTCRTPRYENSLLWKRCCCWVGCFTTSCRHPSPTWCASRSRAPRPMFFFALRFERQSMSFSRVGLLLFRMLEVEVTRLTYFPGRWRVNSFEFHYG